MDNDKVESSTFTDTPSAAGAANLSVLLNSRPWNLETFKDVLLFVMDFRCKFTWEEKSRITIIKILEDKKETFEEFLIEMAQLIPEGGTDSVYEAETVQRYRSGFEFLLDDFPEQLSFCQSLPALLQWDNSLCVEDVSFFPDEKEMQVFASYSMLNKQEDQAMRARKDTHFWWQRYDERDVECDLGFQKFLMDVVEWVRSGMKGHHLMQAISQDIFAVCEDVMPRELKYMEYHLRNLKPYLREYIIYKCERINKDKCITMSAIASLIHVLPALLGELGEMDEYIQLRKHEMAHYEEEMVDFKKKNTIEKEIPMTEGIEISESDYIRRYYGLKERTPYLGPRVVEFHQLSDICDDWQNWLE